ncbi:hypothetical protein Aduo_007942 [Ancylostoma duodenale]
MSVEITSIQVQEILEERPIKALSIVEITQHFLQCNADSVIQKMVDALPTKATKKATRAKKGTKLGFLPRIPELPQNAPCSVVILSRVGKVLNALKAGAYPVKLYRTDSFNGSRLIELVLPARST